MERTDTEMMIMETEMEVETAAVTGHTGQSDVVRDLLTLARQLVSEGKPTQALQTVTFKMIIFLFQFWFVLSREIEFLNFNCLGLSFWNLKSLQLCSTC